MRYGLSEETYNRIKEALDKATERLKDALNEEELEKQI